MKYLTLIIIFNFLLISNLYSKENYNCKDLIDKPIEWSKCIKDKGIQLGKKSIQLGKKGSKKLNTDSTLTDWIKGKTGN